MIVAFIFILGLCIGSFLNVLIYRLHRGEKFITGHSKCLFCGHKLYIKDLVPLFSYLLLKGRCRYCKKSFSRQYFLVEFFTGIIFSLIFLNIIPDKNFINFENYELFKIIFWWIIASFLIIIFVYDLKYYLILDKISIPAIFISFIFNLLLGNNLLNLLFAGILAGGFFLLQYFISKGKWVGGGDIRLGFLMGVILGFPTVLTALFIAYILGSIISIILLIGKQKRWSDKIPFGTFLSLATIITMLYGDVVVNWYFSLMY